MIRDPDTGAVRYFGLYRGVVADNRDPIGKRRVRLQIPQVLYQAVTDWAFPLETMGVSAPVPSIGQGVWVQFEGGDPSYPIWTGTFGAATTVLSMSLEQLSDVNVLAPIDGSVLRWNGTANDWYAASVLPATFVSGTAVTQADTGTVTNTMLAHSSVTINGTAVSLGGTITVVTPDASVTTAKLVDGSVTNAKLANPNTTINGITIPLGATGTIIATTATIADGSVTNAKLANSSLTVNGSAVSLGGSVTVTATPTAGSVTAASISAGGIPTTSITSFDSTVRAYRLDQFAAPTSAIGLNGTVMTNAGSPVNANDVATKGYADALVAGLNYKKEVKATTTGANIPLSGVITLDGVSCVAGDRVLVKDQTTGSQNGIYVVATGAWARSSDGTTMNAGTYVYVDQGTLYADAAFVLTTNDPITVGTTSLTFVQFSGAGQIIAGNGLSKTGNQLAVLGTANRVSVSGGTVDIASTYVGQTSITTVGTISTGTWAGTTIAVGSGGTGATTLTGYVQGNGTGPMTASPTIPASAIAGAGLSLITPTSTTNPNPAGGTATIVGSKVVFSNVAGFTVNGVFSSTYDNYLLLVDVPTATAGSPLMLDLASGGTSSNGSAAYITQIIAATNTAASAAAANINALYLSNASMGTGGSSFEVQVRGPAKAQNTLFMTNSITVNTTTAGSYSWEMCAGMHIAASAFDGFSLTTNSTSRLMSGSVTVYGYNLG